MPTGSVLETFLYKQLLGSLKDTQIRLSTERNHAEGWGKESWQKTGWGENMGK
jgi:hypothetical protein